MKSKKKTIVPWMRFESFDVLVYVVLFIVLVFTFYPFFNSVILSFIFAIIQEPDRAHFYRSYGFWVRFLVCAIVFLLFDLLYFLLMRLAYGA